MIDENIKKEEAQIEEQNNAVDASYDEKMQYLHALEEKVVTRFFNSSKLSV